MAKAPKSGLVLSTPHEKTPAKAASTYKPTASAVNPASKFTPYNGTVKPGMTFKPAKDC